MEFDVTACSHWCNPAPNSALQRAGTHKVLGRGRPSHGGGRERWRARVLKGWRAAAELGS